MGPGAANSCHEGDCRPGGQVGEPPISSQPQQEEGKRPADAISRAAGNAQYRPRKEQAAEEQAIPHFLNFINNLLEPDTVVDNSHVWILNLRS